MAIDACSGAARRSQSLLTRAGSVILSREAAKNLMSHVEMLRACGAQHDRPGDFEIVLIRRKLELPTLTPNWYNPARVGVVQEFQRGSHPHAPGCVWPHCRSRRRVGNHRRDVGRTGS